MHDSDMIDLSLVFQHLHAAAPALFREKVFCLFLRLNQLIDEKSNKLLDSGNAEARQSR
jgi:hypothetical protein